MMEGWGVFSFPECSGLVFRGVDCWLFAYTYLRGLLSDMLSQSIRGLWHGPWENRRSRAFRAPLLSFSNRLSFFFCFFGDSSCTKRFFVGRDAQKGARIWKKILGTLHLCCSRALAGGSAGLLGAGYDVMKTKKMFPENLGLVYACSLFPVTYG